jgi:MFS family permease
MEFVINGKRTEKVMSFRPLKRLTDAKTERGLKLIVVDGLAAEAMTTLTGGTFLVAIAIYLGATDFQIGMLAALPTLTNVFQLFSIWLVQRYNNRKVLVVLANGFARLPLIVIGLLPFLFSRGTSLAVLIFLLSFHYFFGSLAGAGWNSWMKDLVPTKRLGSYYAHRTRLIQILNVSLSLAIALIIDYVKAHFPAYEMLTYSLMFLTGGFLGLVGVYVLSRVPEPQGVSVQGNIFRLLAHPFTNRNFRRLLIFHASWAFAISMAAPFFSAYMIKTLKLPLSLIIGLSILSQFAGILFIKSWGMYADRFSNKTIVNVFAPMYIVCILAWIFTATIPGLWYTILVLIGINVFSGMSTSGINLAMNNMVIKLAPKEEAIVFLAAKSITLAVMGALAPLLAGALADFFATHEFVWQLSWKSPYGTKSFDVVELQHFRFLFLIGACLAFVALQLLKLVKEEGEVDKDLARAEMRTAFRNNVVETMTHPAVRLMYQPYTFSRLLRRKIRNKIMHRTILNRIRRNDAHS